MNLASVLLAITLSFADGNSWQWLMSRPEFSAMKEKLSLKDDSVLEAFFSQQFLSDGEDGIVLPDDVENPLLEAQPAQSPDEVPVEIISRNPDGRVKFFEYGEELFDLMELPEGTAVTTVNSGVFTLRIYGEDKKIREKTVWKNSTGKEEKEIISSVCYDYALQEEEQKEYLKETKEEDFKKKTVTVSRYASDGKITETSVFVREEEKERLSEKRLFTYNAEGKLIQKLLSFYDKDLTPVSEKKHVYSYREGFDEPDEKYYENSRLRISSVFTSPLEKTVSYYFDGGIGMRAFYSDGIKTGEETFYSGGR